MLGELWKEKAAEPVEKCPLRFMLKWNTIEGGKKASAGIIMRGLNTWRCGFESNGQRLQHSVVWRETSVTIHLNLALEGVCDRRQVSFLASSMSTSCASRRATK